MRKPAFQLAALAAASAVIYALAFLWHYSLLEWWQHPQLDITKISHHDLVAGAAYVFAFAALFLLYILACVIVRRDHRAAMWRVTITGIVAFNAILLWLYPVDAADVFDNIIHGRMTAYYGANPFYQTVSEFPRDPFFYYAAWYYYPSAYGPGWELIAAGIARAAGDGILTNVIAFKLASVVAYGATAVLIALTLRRHAPERALSGVLLYAWNPLVLYVTAGNGHNDAVMVFFIVLGFYFLARRQFTLAALAETAGALIKFIPALLLPVIFVVAFRQLRGHRARVIFLFGTLAACAGLVVAAYASFWRGGDILGVARRSDLLTTSVPAMIQVALEPQFGKSFSEFLAIRSAIVLVGAWVIRQVRVVWRHADNEDAVARAGLSILLFYLLLSCPWFQAWYAIWAVAIAALLPDGMLTRGALLLSFVVTWKMPIFQYALVPAPPLPPRAWREWRLTPGTLGAAWAFFVYQGFQRRVKRYESRVARYRQTTGPRSKQNASESAPIG